MKAYKLYNLYVKLTEKGGILEQPIGLENCGLVAKFAADLTKSIGTLLSTEKSINSDPSSYVDGKLKESIAKEWRELLDTDVDFSVEMPAFNHDKIEQYRTPMLEIAFQNVYNQD